MNYYFNNRVYFHIWVVVSANYVYLGSFPLTTCTQTSGIISATQYYGVSAEYYLYAQELTATEVNTLANL